MCHLPDIQQVLKANNYVTFKTTLFTLMISVHSNRNNVFKPPGKIPGTE